MHFVLSKMALKKLENFHLQRRRAAAAAGASKLHNRVKYKMKFHFIQYRSYLTNNGPLLKFGQNQDRL